MASQNSLPYSVVSSHSCVQVAHDGELVPTVSIRCILLRAPWVTLALQSAPPGCGLVSVPPVLRVVVVGQLRRSLALCRYSNMLTWELSSVFVSFPVSYRWCGIPIDRGWLTRWSVRQAGFGPPFHYSNSGLKKRTAITSSIAVGNFEWIRHEFFPMYQFCRETISDFRSLLTLCIAIALTCKLWNWGQYNKWLSRQALKHVSVF